MATTPSNPPEESKEPDAAALLTQQNKAAEKAVEDAARAEAEKTARAAAEAQAAAIEAAAKLSKLSGKLAIKIGESRRFKAAFGDIYHPYLKPEVRFTQENSVKIDVDNWVKVQYDAGKLLLDN
jgi:hypothetical protein